MGATAARAEKPLRLLALGRPAYLQAWFADLFFDDPAYDIEVASAGGENDFSWSRLFELRQRARRGEFDLVLCAPLPAAAPALEAFRMRALLAALRGRTPIAVVDFLETSYVLPGDYPLLRACTLYFKRNLYFWSRRSLLPLETFHGRRRVTTLTAKMRPLSAGLPRREIPDTIRPLHERDIDVCYVGRDEASRGPAGFDSFPALGSPWLDREIQARVLGLKDRWRIFCVDGAVSDEECRELFQRSRLVVFAESLGGETSRHYQAAAAGAVPCLSWPSAQNHLPLQPERHAIYFSPIGQDFERTVERALGDPARLEQIAQEARAFVRERKDPRQIGQWIVEETLRKAG
jgi:hypothetical protein